MVDEERIEHLMMKMVFGSRWSNELTRLVETVDEDRMASLIRRKAHSGDKSWLLKGLKKRPVRSGIVNALIRTVDTPELMVLVEYLGSEQASIETKWASLYILRKVLRRSFIYNPYHGTDRQRKELEHIRRAISEYSLTKR